MLRGREPLKGSGQAGRNATEAERQQAERRRVIDEVRKLSEISRELEQNARLLASAVNLVQAGELRRKVDELTRRQDDLVRRIVARHPDTAERERFEALSRKLDEFRPAIRACQEKEELLRLKEEMDRTVEEWVGQFQRMVADLVGAPPPPHPISGDGPP